MAKLSVTYIVGGGVATRSVMRVATRSVMHVATKKVERG